MRSILVLVGVNNESRNTGCGYCFICLISFLKNDEVFIEGFSDLKPVSLGYSFKKKTHKVVNLSEKIYKFVAKPHSV